MMQQPAFNTLQMALPAAVAPGFRSVHASLAYQARALGIALTPTPASATSNANQALSFALHMSEGAPIACKISAWPETASAPIPASEFSLQAACGVMSVHGRASGRVQALPVPYVSTLSAALALQATLATAFASQRGCTQRQVSTSLAAAGLLAIGQYLAGASATEAPEQLTPNADQAASSLPFISADNIVFELETLEASHWRAFWAELDVAMEVVGKGWQAFMLRYAKAIAPLPPALAQCLRARPYAEIAALAARTGLTICPLRTLAQRATDADALALWQQGPWTFDVQTLANNSVQAMPTDARLPLAGITVIESCRRIQGPLAGHLLALLGAQVIRIEQPGGDPLRGMPPMVHGVSARFDALNRLKTVREIDIKSAQGRAQIHELVQQADVFLHNWAGGKAQQMELDALALRRSNPALVYAYASGWGTDLPLLGTDFMAQAYSGVAAQIAADGTSDGIANGGSLFTVLDVLGGVVASQAVVAALLRRDLQQQAVSVESSLLGAASLLCAEPLQEIFTPNSTPSHSTCLQELYATAAGILAIECDDAAALAWLEHTLADTLALPAEFDVSAIAAILKTKTAQQWLDLFANDSVVGVPPVTFSAALVVEDLRDIAQNPCLATCLQQESYTQIQSPWRFQ